MIYNLDVAGQLEFFWRNHSIQESANQNNTSFASTIVTDDALYIALEEAVKVFMANDKLTHSPAHNDYQSTNQFKLDNLVKLFNERQLVSTQYKNQVNVLNTELELVSAQYKNQVDVLQSVLRSNSWRLTKPIRYLLTKARLLRSNQVRGIT